MTDRVDAAGLARALVAALVHGGVREAVLCPGSRSAPLAVALWAAEQSGDLRLHMRLDERGAGYLALGMASVTAAPVVVACTSGTAVANLHPAVLEAHHRGVPLVVLSADRPPELRGVGANQTTRQPGLFGTAVRAEADLTPGDTDLDLRRWTSSTGRALVAARGDFSGDPGPVHLNAGFREPLLAAATPSGWAAFPPMIAAPSPTDAVAGPTLTVEAAVPTLVIAGDGAGAGVGDLAAAAGWPVLAEPSSGCWAAPTAVASAPLVAGLTDLPRPQRVIAAGHPTLSRAVLGFVAAADVQLVALTTTGRYPDPGRRVTAAVASLAVTGRADDAWTSLWLTAGQQVHAAVTEFLGRRADAVGHLTEPDIARTVVAALPEGSLLWLGPSQPVRDVHLFAAARGDVRVLSNRGLAGIDGVVSSACGAALSHAVLAGRPTVALVGDLTAWHDATGLLRGAGEPVPPLTLVVVDNDGGGIFGLLEPGEDQHRRLFERLFATPVQADLRAWCAATASDYVEVDSLGALADAVAGTRVEQGPRVVHVRVPRAQGRDLHAQLREVAAATRH